MPDFDDISVGDQLPELTRTLDRLELVLYAAGSGDFNELHFDADCEQAQVLGDNIVHGRLKYALLGQLVSDWLKHDGWVQSISCQYRGMDMRRQPLTARGLVTDKRVVDSDRIVELDVWVENHEGAVTTPGNATVVMKR